MVHSTNAKAYIKNFVEDSGDAFDCRTLGYCPRMSFVITNPDGSKKSISLGSDPDAFFDPDAYALYQKTFAIDSRMADAQAITFFFENAKVKPLFDCLTGLYFSNNFSTSTLIDFIKPGNGYYLDDVTITKIGIPCTDDPNWRTEVRDKSRDCSWIGKAHLSVRCQYDGIDGMVALHACPEQCNPMC